MAVSSDTVQLGILTHAELRAVYAEAINQTKINKSLKTASLTENSCSASLRANLALLRLLRAMIHTYQRC